MPGAFYYRGFEIECDTGGLVKNVDIFDADTETNQPYTGGPGVSQIQQSGQTQARYSFPSPFVAHMIRTVPQDQVPWRVWKLIPVGEVWPELLTSFTTPPTTHGLIGYNFIYRLEIVWASNASFTITPTVQAGPGVTVDGTSPVPITIPSSGGVKEKALFTPTFNKGQLFSYNLTGGPFRLFAPECIVWVGQWGRPKTVVPWRGLDGDFSQARG